jgi:type IV fimbrial biogenesis protein FimT
MNPSTKKNLKQKGFSLIELLVTMSILLLLVFVAVPGFSNFSSNSRVDSVQSNFHSAILVARNEAIKRNTVVKLCAKQANSDQCQIPATPSWANGWLVFIDGSDDNDRALTATAERLLVSNAIANNVTFRRTTAVGDPARGTLCFSGLGLLCSDKDNASEFVVDTVSDANAQYVRKLNISIVGKVLLSSDKYK